MKALAITMDRYGGPDVLQATTVAVPQPRSNELRLRVLAAAVNHTDLEIRAGRWPIRALDPFPYVPGVEVVGVVDGVGSVAGHWSPGQVVITMMQGLGGVRAERPGGYAEYVIVDSDAVAEVRPGIDPLTMAAVGLAGVTALNGVARLGSLAGRDVLVNGAAGGVGSAALAIARAQGAHVTAVLSHAEQTAMAKASGASDVVVVPRGQPVKVPPLSVDGVLDVVGGVQFAGCVGALRDGGSLCLVGAVGGGDVGFDAWNLIRPVTLTGYSSETLDGTQLREAVAKLSAWLEDRSLLPPSFTTVPLQDAASAHAMLERGDIHGRLLLVPHSA